MRPASELIRPLRQLPRPARPRAPLAIAREPEGHGPHRVAARHGAHRHDPCGPREGQAHGNGNRDTRRQRAEHGKPGRTPHLIGPAAETGRTGKIISARRSRIHGNLTGSY
jgi:hypothetical protein